VTRQDNQPVIVFGAGEAGRRALACLRRDGGWDVLAFADNATDRHGTTFEDLPVVAPASLIELGAERVVVASQAAAQIVPQLRALGIRQDQIDLYHFADDRIVAVEPAGPECPRILVLTDDCISPSHGTGAVLLRHFAGYPRERLLHGYLRLKGDPFLPHSFKVAPSADVTASDAEGTEKRTRSAAQLVAEITRSHGPIDLVYSNFFGETGLVFLRELLGEIGASVPVIHHVHDLLADNDERFDARLREVAPRVTEFWAIGPGLAERVRAATGRSVTLMNTFSCPITPTFKREHRDVTPDFTAVMLGNSHMPWVLDKVRSVWAEVRRRHGVGPIRWFAYPTSVLYVERAGVRIDPDIEYYGYLSDRVLHQHLCAADLAIIPFNIADEPEYGYARYSIPSRLTEFLNAGLPVFAAAGRNTEARRFIAHHRIGTFSTIADTETFTRDLFAIVESAASRRALGAASRTFATEHCDVERYRERLFARIGALTQFDFGTVRLKAA
jgi:hypothetical protein